MKRSSAAALALLAVLTIGATAGSAYAQSPRQTGQDLTRMQRLNAVNEGSLRNRAETAARDARSVVSGERINCDVTSARFIGYTRGDNLLVEVACNKAAGFIVDTSTPSPRAFDCRVLAAGAAEARAAGVTVPRTSVCTLPENIRG